MEDEETKDSIEDLVSLDITIDDLNKRSFKGKCAIVNCDETCLLCGDFNQEDLVFYTAAILHTTYTALSKFNNTHSLEDFAIDVYNIANEMLHDKECIKHSESMYTDENFTVDLKELLKQMGENQ